MTPVRALDPPRLRRPAGAAAHPGPLLAAGAPANGAMSASTAEALVLVVAPGNGRFRPRVGEGVVGAGEVIAVLATGGGPDLEVLAPADTLVHGLLARAGQLVTAGHVLVWGTRIAREAA